MVETAKLGIVHAVMECRDCPWRNESLRGVQHAAEHHERTGHEVTGETGIAYRWPRQKRGDGNG